MHFLFTALPEKIGPDSSFTRAPAGEPAVPWFPTAPLNMFVGLKTFGLTEYAVVQNRTDVDMDLYVRRLCAQYPGLPEKLHERYVLEVAKAAASFQEGTRFQIFTDPKSAKLKVLDHDVTVTLWTRQPLEG